MAQSKKDKPIISFWKTYRPGIRCRDTRRVKRGA